MCQSVSVCVAAEVKEEKQQHRSQYGVGYFAIPDHEVQLLMSRQPAGILKRQVDTHVAY